MNELPAVLSVSEVPLAQPAEELVTQFNAAQSALGGLLRAFPDAVKEPRVLRWLKDLSELRNRLCRPRYQVGFLGTTGAGKSTTFNHFLGLAPDDPNAPAREGVSKATTSSPTRLHHDSNYTLRVRYMTPEQFATIRSQLCEACDLNPQRDNRDLLTDLAEARREPAGRAERIVLPADLDALEQLLRSCDAFVPSVVRLTSPPTERVADYHRDRQGYINHPAGPAKPSPNLLIREVELGLPNDNLPEQLELIDLPGLGAKGSLDSIVTKTFLGELDGALLFLRADQLEDANAEQLLEHLKRHFHRELTGRIWVVVTKLDGLGQTHWRGDLDSQMFFDSLGVFLRRHDLPADRVLLVCNEIHKRRGPDGTAPIETALTLLKQTTSEPIPPKFRDDPLLREAFLAVIADGGIARLRRVIREELRRDVGAQLAKSARQSLTALAAAATHFHELRAAQPADLRPFKRARARIAAIIDALESPTEFRELDRQLARSLEEDLTREFEESALEAPLLHKLDSARLAEEFQHQSALLETQFGRLIREQVVDAYCQAVTERLRSVPSVPIGIYPDVVSAWADTAQTEQSWPGLPMFVSDELFAPKRGSGLTGEDYAALMREKVRTASRQAVHAVRMGLRERLRLIEDELAVRLRG